MARDLAEEHGIELIIMDGPHRFSAARFRCKDARTGMFSSRARVLRSRT